MAIGELEPLYRYLKGKGRVDPVTAILKDVETLACGNYINGIGDGMLVTVDDLKIDKEISEKLEALRPPPPMSYHWMYQAIGDRMYISLSRINQYVSKTALALCIMEDDTVTIDYLEHGAIFNQPMVGQTMWNSISTVIVQEDGSTVRGFLRVESQLFTDTDGNKLAFRADFRLNPNRPFYVSINNCRVANQYRKAFFGDAAKKDFLSLESQWKT